LGYSLGSGSFDTYAPYKAGYVFKVGSENSVTVYGTLLKANGEPVSLLTGTAVREGAAAAPVAVFTNGEGRFGAEGLAPGRWVVAMQSESGVLTYRIDVPAGANGLVKVGTLQPTEERAP
jgi:outer membrane usher protein